MSKHYTITISSLATSAPPRVVQVDSWLKMLSVGSMVIKALFDAYGNKIKMHDHPVEDNSHIWTLPVNGVDTPIVEMIVDETPEEEDIDAIASFT